jgi:A nuclease family of the HNH/ENDO VII superfamily with conserved AHH
MSPFACRLLRAEVSSQNVCNLTVRDYHTFLVGAEGLLAHNESWCEILEKQFKWKKPQALIDIAESSGYKLGRIHGHHIVMRNGGGIFGYQARKLLEKYGIDVLYSQKALKSSSPKELHNMAMALNNHRGIHSQAYAKAVYERLKNVVDQGIKDGLSKAEIAESIKEALAEMRKTMERGEIFWPE